VLSFTVILEHSFLIAYHCYMKIEKLAIAISFHYREDRIQYLEKIASQFSLLAHKVLIHIFTNVGDDDKKLLIMNTINLERKLAVEIHTPTYLGHPYLLTWSHFCIFRELFYRDKSISHFMYLEDDIYLTPKNIGYWLKAREELRISETIPSFLRYEKKEGCEVLYSTDALERLSFKKLSKIKKSETYYYLNLTTPYQGMYLLDRELMHEHLTGPSSVPENSPWGIREKAAAGLTFVNVPKGYYSRNLIGYDFKNKCIDPNSLIHHLPNNYVGKPDSPHAKIKVNELIIHGLFW
jgi:hypothetical protein